MNRSELGGASLTGLDGEARINTRFKDRKHLAMPARFKPIYGYGWFDRSGIIDEPPPFQIEGALDGAGRIEGLIAEQDHPLTGMWVALTIRTSGEPTNYNVEAFLKRADESPTITGFATALP